MPKFLEAKLRDQAAKEGVSDPDRYIFGTLNNMGAMHGNKETALGASMDAKHAADALAKRKKPPTSAVQE